MTDRNPAEIGAYQERVGAWVETTFGRASLTDRAERARRLLEEAAEAAQALGLPRHEAQAVLRDVYAREPGEPGQEMGGVMNTLAAACAGLGIDLQHASLTEMERIERPEVIGKCRRKNADKQARGVSSAGLAHNRIIFGENAYPVTQAYAEGVIAARGGQLRFDRTPYPVGSAEHDEWSVGFENASEWDHVLDGRDVLNDFPEGIDIIAPLADLQPGR